ncbi:MAG TPA: DUF2085 domain-containing protein [Ktedonobacterales bacterium]
MSSPPTPHDHTPPPAPPSPQAWWDAQSVTLDGIGPRRMAFSRAMVSAVNAVDHGLRRHWLAGVNTLLALFIGVAVAAPIMRAVGLVGPSQSLLAGYHLFCAQTPSHSFYIAGHQMCLCARCLAIYSSLLAGGLVLAILRRQGRPIRAITFPMWVVAALPMALDGGTQLLGLRESDWFLRLLTGAIFGLATAWYALPQLHEVATEMPRELAVQAAPAPRA